MLGLSFAIILLALSICTVGLMLVQTYDRHRIADEQRRREVAAIRVHTERTGQLLAGILYALAKQPDEHLEAWYRDITGEEFRDEQNQS